MVESEQEWIEKYKKFVSSVHEEFLSHNDIETVFDLEDDPAEFDRIQVYLKLGKGLVLEIDKTMAEDYVQKVVKILETASEEMIYQILHIVPCRARLTIVDVY